MPGRQEEEHTLAARVARLEDIEAIKVLKAQYCAACDSDHDPELVGALFVEDAVWEASGIIRAEGRPAIKQYMADLRATGRIRNSAHNVFNPQIEVNGDTATGHWRLLMLYTANIAPGTVQHQRIIGWYRERYVRSNGQWRYASLYCEVEESSAYALEPDKG